MGDKAIKIEPEDDHNAEKQHSKQPPMKVTKNFKGGQRDYNFLQTVNSVEELDNFRFKNYCCIDHRAALPTFNSNIMRCTRKRIYKPGKQCDFELLALRQKPKSDTIHVYAYSEHNHPLKPEEERAMKRAKQLLPDDDDENPPKICKLDNIKFRFFQTFPDYDQLEEFRRKSHCTIYLGRKSQKQVRLHCKHSKRFNCEFQLLSVKSTNTKQGYDVYTFGAHKHTVIKPKKKQQPAARGRQQKQQEMEVDEEEDDEDGPEEDEEGEGQAEDEPIEEGGGGGEEDNGTIVIDDEEDDITKVKVEPKHEVKREVSLEIIENPLGNEPNPTDETFEETVQKAKINACYAWMARYEPNQIEPKIAGMNIDSVLDMVQIANQEVRQHPAKFDLWRPWLKHAMPKCISEVEDFDNSKYKHLTGLMWRHVQD